MSEEEPAVAPKRPARARTSVISGQFPVRVDYRAALEIVHAVLNPRTYVEIGCQNGSSLKLARCPSIAIDPDFKITHPLVAPTRIVRETSERFFKKYNLRTMNGGPFDLAFIDGQHLAETALLDFINLEVNSSATSVIVLDDVLPADIVWASRERRTQQWTGDVYKVPIILRTMRPDLSVGVFDIDYKGMAIVSRLNSKNRHLSENYEKLRGAILAGTHELNSAAAIRDALQPQPVADLVPHLVEIAVRRSPRLAGWTCPRSHDFGAGDSGRENSG